MSGERRTVQAILLAGDRGHARAVKGRSKAFIPVSGRPMIVHVLEALLHAPEVSEVYAVGNPVELEKAIAEYGILRLAASRSRPVHIVPQRDTLFDNIWYTFLRTLPDHGSREDHAVLVVPSDLPLLVPEEISDFVQQAWSIDADYVVGLSPESALIPYAPHDGEPGIRMACFNVREGRFRQNNLHFVRPLRMGNRHYIQDMYENRYQKEVGNMIRLGWRIFRKEFRHLWVLFFYALMHLAAVMDRWGHRRLATRFRAVSTGLGGAALDVDNDADFEVVDKMLFRWKERQARLARLAPRT
jgi:molybdopterin-guanine dinucleotide biosynthesis protein A